LGDKMSSSGQTLAPGYSSEVDDTVLVREAQSGNTQAFEELARHYDQAVLRLALHLTGSPEAAQEIYQDAFVRAYRNLPQFRFQCSFYTWLYRIVTNVCLDRLQSNRLPELDMGVRVSAPSAGEQRAGQIQEVPEETCPERVRRALLRLSARERMVFELKHYQGLKLQTVATLLNSTENTIKNTLFRATQKLRSELAGLR
jgi:RNA polymerase sigma-70 factor, ECF subfamily